MNIERRQNDKDIFITLPKCVNWVPYTSYLATRGFYFSTGWWKVREHRMCSMTSWTGKTCMYLPNFSLHLLSQESIHLVHSGHLYMSRHKHVTIIMPKWMGVNVFEMSIKCIIGIFVYIPTDQRVQCSHKLKQSAEESPGAERWFSWNVGSVRDKDQLEDV